MTYNAATYAERRAEFKALHERGCFMLPNPWDTGTARYLAHLGFKALATTSSGQAFSLGRPDGTVNVDLVLNHIHTLVHATPLPVNADFEDGHAADHDVLADNIRRCIKTGISGLSLEDATGLAHEPRYSIGEAVARLKVARRVINDQGGDVLLIGRAEHHIGARGLADTISRLSAYADAGADCLYAPGLTTIDEVKAVVSAVSPRPVNVLVNQPAQFTFDELGAAGVRRISVGGALALAAWSGFARAATHLVEGRFDGFDGPIRHAYLNAVFDKEHAE